MNLFRAENEYQNVEAWRCSTMEVIEVDQNLFFDLAY